MAPSPVLQVVDVVQTYGFADSFEECVQLVSSGVPLPSHVAVKYYFDRTTCNSSYNCAALNYSGEVRTMKCEDYTEDENVAWCFSLDTNCQADIICPDDSKLTPFPVSLHTDIFPDNHMPDCVEESDTESPPQCPCGCHA